MEERIIDDEYGRGVRFKKTKDGYVDATDELAEEEKDAAENGESGELEADAEEDVEEESVLVDGLEEGLENLEEDEGGEEVTFEFPELEEDDEDLVNLTPEEAEKLRKKKAEEAVRRKEEYAALCKEGDELLLSGSYKAAELKFEKALSLEENAWEAAVGYWRARTSDFSEPDVLMDEYAETGYESLENDLGEDAADALKKQFKEVFEKRLAEVSDELAPLEKEVEEKQNKRRSVLKARLSASRKGLFGTALPMLVFLVLGIVFGSLITTRKDGLFVVLTAVSAVLFFVCFIAFGVFTNRFVNNRFLNRANEDLSSTEEGRMLLKLRAYKELYGHFVG